MSWAKVDDRTHEDPRTEAAGVEAMGLWVLALAYMAAHSTDGRITVERCRRLAGPQKGRRLADRLVAAGWWEQDGPDAYRLVEWERLLLPRAAVEERSARAADAGRLGGKAKASRARSSGEEVPKAEESSGIRWQAILRPTPEPCSESSDGNPAESKEIALPTPAHDPDPTRPDPDSAHARVRVQAQDEDQGGGQQPIAQGPSPRGSLPIGSLCVPPAVEDPAGDETGSFEQESLQNKGAPVGVKPGASLASTTEPKPEIRPQSPPVASSPAVEPLKLAPVDTSPPAPRGRKKAAHDMPEGWGPKPEHYALGGRYGFTRTRVDLEAQKFREHHGAKGSQFVSWDLAFNTWLRKANDFDGQRGGPPAEPEPEEPEIDDPCILRDGRMEGGIVMMGRFIIPRPDHSLPRPYPRDEPEERAR